MNFGVPKAPLQAILRGMSATKKESAIDKKKRQDFEKDSALAARAFGRASTTTTKDDKYKNEVEEYLTPKEDKKKKTTSLLGSF